MKVRTSQRLIPWVIIVWCASLAQGGQIEIAEYPPIDPPDCDTAGAGGNPDEACGMDGTDVGMGDPYGAVCAIDLGGSVEGQTMHVQRAFECNDSGSGPGFDVSILHDTNDRPIGFEVLQGNGSEVTALCFRESRATIESVTVRLDPVQAGMARVNTIPESVLTGGWLELEINGILHSFQTRSKWSRGYLNDRIRLELETKWGYTIATSGSYLLIQADPFGDPIHEVRLWTNDLGVTDSEVSIEPLNLEPYPYCFPG